MWIRSSFCNVGTCVEISLDDAGQVLVRDSKTPAAEPLTFTIEEWQSFLAGVKAGEFDLPPR